MHSLSILIKNKAKELGFDACGIAEVASADTEALFFDRWIAEGCHAGMKYMENYRDIRLDPAGLVEGARSVISVALNYYPPQKQSPGSPRISYYAYGKDYHIVVKDKLRQLWEYITSLVPVLDTGLQVSRPLRPENEEISSSAAPCQTRGQDSSLDYDTPQKNRCGACRRCLDACPTGALERPGHLNANKCISYLTIEHKGDIPSEQASRLGDRLYGCDTCQEVCPWNRFASPTREAAFSPSPAFLSLKKEDLRCFTRDDYNRIFAGSAVKRAKYEGLIRTINNKKE